MQKLSLPLLAALSITAINSAQADSTTLINPSNEHSYKRFDTAETWSQAKNACANQGGYLATITSQNENDWVWSKFGASTGVYEGAYKGFWLGGSDATTEGQWTWITGELWNYSNWDTGQPDNASGRGQSYTVMWNYNVEGSWDDGGLPYTDPKTSYLCEWSSFPNDILGGFLDLNNSSFDYANNQIKLTFTVPPEQLGNYFNADIKLNAFPDSVTWPLAAIQAQLQSSNPITLGFDGFSLKAHPDQLLALQFRSKNALGIPKTKTTFQGIYDKVRQYARKAIINSRTVANTKPNNTRACANQQGIKSVCNNYFNSMETGTNNFKIAVDRNLLTHRLVDFDQIAPVAAINTAWANSGYGKAPQQNNGRIPLLLVHGWQGGTGLRNPAQLGLSDNTELQYWRHFLDYYLATPELQNKYHVYLYHYPTYKHITYNASVLTTLLNELATKQPASDLAVARQKNGKGVVVLAHSMGGLVTRSATEEYDAFGHNAESLRRLITLDTPHHGSPAANPWFAKFATLKDLYTQGAADIQWDNFDTLYSNADVAGFYTPRWDSAINSKSFDGVYNTAYKDVYQTVHQVSCNNAPENCPTTQNPWLAWLNTRFIPSVNTYGSKYLLYAGWMMSASADEGLSGGIINNGLMAASDTLLGLGTWGVASGGAEPVHSSLWYVQSPLEAGATPFPLLGTPVESPYFLNVPTSCLAKSNWDASQWFGGELSTIEVYKSFEKACGNSILISKSEALSEPNPNHPLGFQLRVFWDYDHETMVNGAYWKKLGIWDKYIGKPPYLIKGNTLADSGFLSGTMNLRTATVARDNYIATALRYLNNNETLAWGFNSPANYNPLTLEPLFNVLQRDLIREADSLVLGGSWTYNPATGHYYKVLDCGDWEQCEAQAVALGAHLVTINDQAENDWVVNSFLGDDVLWIGYTDKDQEGSFKWVSGESSIYTNWDVGEPNNCCGGENYVHLWGKNWAFSGLRVYGTWNDLPLSGVPGDVVATQAIIELTP